MYTMNDSNHMNMFMIWSEKLLTFHKDSKSETRAGKEREKTLNWTLDDERVRQSRKLSINAGISSLIPLPMMIISLFSLIFHLYLFEYALHALLFLFFSVRACFASSFSLLPLLLYVSFHTSYKRLRWSCFSDELWSASCTLLLMVCL